MKVVLLLALCALAFGQLVERESLSPSSGDNDFPNTDSDSTSSWVVGCDTNVHRISGIQSGSDTSSSTISIFLDNSVDDRDDQDLYVVLYDSDGAIVFPTDNREPQPTDINDASFPPGPGFECSSGETCLVDYHCDRHVGGTYEAHVWQNNGIAEVNNYTIGAWEWSESAQDLGITADGGEFEERDEESAEEAGTDLLVDSVPGPRTFRHYYLDLERDLEERGRHTRIIVKVKDWLTTDVDNDLVNITSGVVALCYSTNYFVGATGSTDGLDGSEVPCSDICENFNLASEEVEIEFENCDIPDTLWLGIRTPEGVPARYTIEVNTVKRTRYPVTTITDNGAKLDGYIGEYASDFCAPSEGTYSCENYYEMSLDSIGESASSFQNSGHGPWFVAHIHGVKNGDLMFTVNDDNFGGPKSHCSDPLWVCGGDNGNFDNSDDNVEFDRITFNGPSIHEGQECYVMIPPCYWQNFVKDNATDFEDRNWVTTVVGLELDEEYDQIFYAIDFDILSMPIESVSLAPQMGPWFGKVRSNFYNHYSLAIADGDILPSSKLVVELYARHEDHDLELLWNRGEPAGYSRDCLNGWWGRCSTLGDQTLYESESYLNYGDNRNYCRFAFIACDNPSKTGTLNDPRLVNDSLAYESTNLTSSSEGLRVSSLVGGTYYFAVHAPRYAVDFDSYDYESHFTLQMSFTGAQELVENEPVLQHVYLNEYSTHYYFDMPDTEEDPLAQGIELYVADVQNFWHEEFSGEVSAHWNCDNVAGNCPCFDNVEYHEFDARGDHHKIFYIPRCECPGRVWLSVENRAIFGAYNLSTLKPVGFTVTARVVRSALENEVSGSLFDPDSDFVKQFSVPRDTWGKVASSIAPVFDEASCRSCLQYRFYQFQFNSLQAGDAFVTRLEFVPDIEDATPEAWLWVISNFDEQAQIDPGCGNSPLLDGRIQGCRARANLDEPWLGRPGEEWSFCQLVFEPCTADIIGEGCYDELNERTNTNVQARQFDQTRQWYGAVQSLDVESAIIFTLQAQVRSQAAVSLTNGVALQGRIFEGTYNHYSISVSGSSSSPRSLFFEFYSILDQASDISFFINVGAFAGLEQDCLESVHSSLLGLCEECHLKRGGDDTLYYDDYYNEHAASCSYQVKPCDLQDTTYYVSAYQYTDKSRIYTHAFFDDRFYYTIVARIEEATNLLATGHPVTGQLWNWYAPLQGVQSTAFYTVQVPSSLDESRLAISIGSLSAGTEELVVSITQTSPIDFCRCPLVGARVGGDIEGNYRDTDTLEWTRDWCDLTPGEVYYVQINGIMAPHAFLPARINAEPATFSIHAEILPYDLIEVELIAQTDNENSANPVFLAPIAQYYDSAPGAIKRPSISPSRVQFAWNQFASYYWDVSNRLGRSMNVRFWQSHGNTSLEQTFSWTLSHTTPISDRSSNGQFDTLYGGLGLSPFGSECNGTLVAADTGDYTSVGSAVKIHVNPCELLSARYFLTFGNAGLEVNSEVPRVDLKITLVDALEILETPSGTEEGDEGITDLDALNTLNGGEDEFFDTLDEDNEVEFNLGEGRYFATDGSISLSAGEVLVFEYDGSGDFEVAFDGLPCDNWACRDSSICEFFACESISGEWWVRLVDPTSATSFTISILPSEVEDSNLSVDSVDTIEFGEDAEELAAFSSEFEWQWHRLTHSPSNEDDIVRRFDARDVGTLYLSTTGSPVFAPAIQAVGESDWHAVYEDSLRAGRTTSPPNCGTREWSSPAEDIDGACCLRDLDILFAVADNAAGDPDDVYQLEFIAHQLNEGGVSNGEPSGSDSVGTNGSDEEGEADGRTGVAWYSFEIEEDSIGFYYEFSSDDMDIDEDTDFTLYANIGRRAGSQSGNGCPSVADDNVEGTVDAAFCHGNIDLGDISCSVSPGDDPCVGFVPICEDCLSPGARVYMAVTSDFAGAASFNLDVDQFTANTDSLTLGFGSSSASGSLPASGLANVEERLYELLDDAGIEGCNAMYNRYVVNVEAEVDSFLTHSSYFPDFDSELADEDTFRVILRMTDIQRDVEGFTQDDAEAEVEWFISLDGGLAGDDCGCYAGEDWQSFCEDEEVLTLGDPEDETYEFSCTIPATVLLEEYKSCSDADVPLQWTMSVRRGRSIDGEEIEDQIPGYDYRFEVEFLVNDTQVNEYNIQSISLSSSEVTPGDVPSSFSSISSTNDFGDATAESCESWISVDVSSLGPTEYVRVWFELDLEDLGIGEEEGDNAEEDFDITLSVEPFMGYYTFGAAVPMQWNSDYDSPEDYDDARRNDCGEVEFDEDGLYICSIQFAPRDLAQFFGPDGQQKFWLKVSGFDCGLETQYDFGVFAERREANVFSYELTPDSVFANDTVFNIVDREWQFHRVTVPENRGLYSSFRVSVFDQSCSQNPLEIWSTFAYPSEAVDVMRPARLPTPTSHVGGDSASFELDLNCNIDGGNYWVGVWAPNDFQLFPDPISIPDGDRFEVRSGSYRVGMSLQEWEQKVLDPECAYTARADEFIPRIVIPVEAENRGSDFWVSFSYAGGDELSSGDWGLGLSHNNLPFGADECSWDATTDTDTETFVRGDFYCESDSRTCSIRVPACEFESGYWHVYVYSLENFRDEFTKQRWLTVTSRLDRKHIPVVTLDATNDWTHTFTGMLAQDYFLGTNMHQYFKVIVDADSQPEGHLEVWLNDEGCDACDFDMYMTRGPVGHASYGGTYPNEHATGNCLLEDVVDYTWDARDDYECKCHDDYWGIDQALEGLYIVDTLCAAEDNQWFIGVTSDDFDQCEFSVTVTAKVAVETMVPDEIICSTVSCTDYYRLDLSGVEGFIDYIEFEVYNLGVSPCRSEPCEGHPLIFQLNEGRVPYMAAFEGGRIFDSDFTGADTSTCDVIQDTVELTEDEPDRFEWSLGSCTDPGELYIAIRNSEGDVDDCDTCDGISYQLKAKVYTVAESQNFTTVRVSAPTLLTSYVGPVQRVIGGQFVTDDCTPECGVYGVSGEEEEYLVFTKDINNPNDTLIETLSSNAINDGDRVTITDWFGDEAIYRTFTPLATDTEFKVHIGNVDSACDFDIADIFYYVAPTGTNFTASCFCDDGALFSTEGCSDSAGSSETFNCFEGNAGWLISITTCRKLRCPVSFDLWVEAEGEERTQVGTAHNDANGWNLVTLDRDCSPEPPQYYVDVAEGQPLSVQLREPFGGDTVQWTADFYRQDTSCIEDSVRIDASETTLGLESTARGDYWEDSVYGCTPAGRYYIDLSLSSGADAEYDYVSVEFAVWNEWVTISGSATDVMFGNDRHFYSFTNAGAAKIVLEITNGPAIAFRVTDNTCESHHYHHHQYCAYGRCLVDISTEALNSGADTYYIVLESGYLAGDATMLRHRMDNSVKNTEYTLSVATGSSACTSRPSVGFCGGSPTDVDPSFTNAAWDGTTGGSWDYENPTVRDNMARWKYDSFITGLCPSPSDECKEWLRRIACADAFPSCDASGFLLGTCRDACYEAECACGKWLADSSNPEFGCLSGRYQPERTGTCFTIPDRRPPPPPPMVNVTVNFEDTCDVHIGTLDAGLIDIVRATACSASDVERLLLAEAGGLVIASQVVTNEILGNEISVTFYGSNVESAVSICTRVVNLVTVNRDPALRGTCLQDAVAQIEENTDLINLEDTDTYVAPTSVVDPPPVITIPGFTVPSVTVPSFTVPSTGYTIPDLLSSSPAPTVVPAVLAVLVACVLAFFA